MTPSKGYLVVVVNGHTNIDQRNYVSYQQMSLKYLLSIQK